ncbi:MAG: DUF2147 domain-containing protein [Sphingomonas sp.]
MSIALLALALAVPAPAPAPKPDSADITGVWRLQNKKALVRIGPCGQTWCGRITKILKPLPYRKSHDMHNPDAKLRGRSIVGIAILSELKRDGHEWRGRVYDPVHGHSYRAIVERDGPDRLKVKGCITLFCKTQIWDRAR